MSLLLDAFNELHTTDERREGRYYGFLYGVVTTVGGNNDFGRIKARIGAQGDKEETDWLDPFWSGAIESIPNKGDAVIVGFVDGDTSRGFWGAHPESTSKNRPTEAMVLGTTAAGMYNDLASKVQSLISKYNQAQADITTLFTLVNTTGLAVVAALAKANPTVTQTSSSDGDTIGKIKAADGSVVAAKSGDNVALSGKSRVR